MSEISATAEAPAPTRPALRYFGGKWRLGEWIIGQFPPHECYVEPFGGAASVLLQKRPARVEVYNDLDREVVAFFKVLREQPAELVRSLVLTPYAREELEAAFAPAPPDMSEVERARRLFVRSWQGRGGGRTTWRSGWRYQRSASLQTSIVEDWADNLRLLGHAERFRHVQIESDPALEVIARYDSPETLFYCDPPYLPETRSGRWASNGYAHEMTAEDHAELLERLRGARGMVVLSGYPSALYDELLPGWRRLERAAQAEGSNRSSRPLRTEVLWISPNAVSRGYQLALEGGE